MREFPADNPTSVRLNKVIADSGYCARRKADELIAAGQVEVNGETVRTLGLRVIPGKDQVMVQGKPLPAPKKIYILLHKPEGYVTSRKAGKSQKTVYALLPEAWHSADPAGRLDQDSSGLLILSNDGDFVHQVTHPRFHWPKVYEVRLANTLTEGDINLLEKGVTLLPEDKLARMQQVTPVDRASQIYRMILVTGYNRQIRRSVEALNNRVISLKRLSLGDVQLGNLPVGQSRLLNQTEIDGLRRASEFSPPPKQR